MFLVSAAMGAALVAGAGTRLIDEIDRQLALASVDRIGIEERVPAEALLAAARTLETLAVRANVARAASDASRAWASLAEDPTQTSFARANLEATRRTAIRAVSATPGDSYAWYRLAFATAGLVRFEEAARALAMSIRTGPFDYSIMNPRSRATLALWVFMDASDRQAASLQLFRHWQWEPSGIAGIAYFDRSIPIALAIAAAYPDMARDLETRFARIRTELGENPPPRPR